MSPTDTHHLTPPADTHQPMSPTDTHHLTPPADTHRLMSPTDNHQLTPPAHRQRPTPRRNLARFTHTRELTCHSEA